MVACLCEQQRGRGWEFGRRFGATRDGSMVVCARLSTKRVVGNEKRQEAYRFCML